MNIYVCLHSFSNVQTFSNVRWISAWEAVCLWLLLLFGGLVQPDMDSLAAPLLARRSVGLRGKGSCLRQFDYLLGSCRCTTIPRWASRAPFWVKCIILFHLCLRKLMKSDLWKYIDVIFSVLFLYHLLLLFYLSWLYCSLLPNVLCCW